MAAGTQGSKPGGRSARAGSTIDSTVRNGSLRAIGVVFGFFSHRVGQSILKSQ